MTGQKPFGILYQHHAFMTAAMAKIQAGAHFNKLTIAIDKSFEPGVTTKSPEYLAKFPMGKVPAFETPSGFLLTETSAISYYVAESGPARDQLLGRTAEERALVQMWISLGDSELQSKAVTMLSPIKRGTLYVKEIVDKAEEGLFRALKRIELHLSQPSKKWLVRDDECSLADITVGSSLIWPLKFFMTADCRAQYPNVMLWWDRLMGIEEVSRAFQAPIQFCEKRPAPDGSDGDTSL